MQLLSGPFVKTKLVCLAYRYICLRDKKGDVPLVYPLGLKSLGHTIMIFVWGLALVPDYITPYTVPKANITIHNKLHDLILCMQKKHSKLRTNGLKH